MKLVGRCTLPTWRTVFTALSLICVASAFSPPHHTASPVKQRIHHAVTSLNAHNNHKTPISHLLQTFTTVAILTLPLQPLTPPANADEYGRETEAPTLFTGETVMICKKRGPLGACIETTLRTSANDNDKSLEYFRDPSEAVKRRQAQVIKGAEEEEEGNELIMKLRRQSVENREKNENEVRVKTLMNDQAASFGPFDRQVVILNTDGKTFTLLENPQAMRLKKAGYIGKDRKFIIQPSQEVINEALEGKNDLGEAIKGIFGGGDQVKVAENADVGSVVESTDGGD